MDVAPTLAEQLRVLSSSPDAWADAAAWAWGRQHPGPAGDVEGAAGPSDDELTAGWGRLSREVVAVVPSCVAVSMALSRLGIDVVITAPPAAPEPMPRALQVLSSLALSLPAAGSGCLLVLQASTPRAFVLLAEELAVLRGSGHQPPELDAHLAPVATSTGSALAKALADLGLLERALGVLIDQGWPPESGERELHRRASAAGLTVTGVAERMLAPSSPALPDGLD